LKAVRAVVSNWASVIPSRVTALLTVAIVAVAVVALPELPELPELPDEVESSSSLWRSDTSPGIL